MCHIILDEQSAFVPRRLISKNVIVAYEAMHSLRRKTRGKVGLLPLKLDMSKAYDRVEWSFLIAIMQRVVFSEKWVAIVWDCIELVSFSFIVNGTPQGLIFPSRGIRQDCPISPYLFLLCAKDFSTYQECSSDSLSL